MHTVSNKRVCNRIGQILLPGNKMVTAADTFDTYQLNWGFQDWGRGIRDRRWLL